MRLQGRGRVKWSGNATEPSGREKSEEEKKQNTNKTRTRVDRTGQQAGVEGPSAGRLALEMKMRG